jgi:hypothetical protein
MEHRVASIVQLLRDNNGLTSDDMGDGWYEIIDGIISYDKAFIRFEVSDDVIRFEMRYMFGFINPEKDISNKDVIKLLIENIGTFKNTGSYLSAKIVSDIPFLFLNAYHYYLKKWEDADIADMIGLQFADINMAFITMSYPDTICRLRPECG